IGQYQRSLRSLGFAFSDLERGKANCVEKGILEAVDRCVPGLLTGDSNQECVERAFRTLDFYLKAFGRVGYPPCQPKFSRQPVHKWPEPDTLHSTTNSDSKAYKVTHDESLYHRKPVIHTGACFSRHFQNSHTGPDVLNVAIGRIAIKLGRRS